MKLNSTTAYPHSKPCTKVIDILIASSNDTISEDTADRIKIDTQNIKGSISLVGARIDDIQLKNFKETMSKDSPLVQILKPASSQKPFYIHHGWVAGPKENIVLPNEKSIWKLVRGNTLTETSPITLEWDNGDGLTFSKKIEIDSNYLFTINQSITNNTSEDFTLYPYSLISRNGIPDDYTNFFVLHEGFIGVLGESGEKKADYNDIAKNPESFENINGGWLGFTDKNWATVIIPPSDLIYQGRFTSLSNGNTYQVDYLGSAQDIKSGSIINIESMIFSGAKQVNILDKYEEEHSIEKFDLLVDLVCIGPFCKLSSKSFIVSLGRLNSHGLCHWRDIGPTFFSQSCLHLPKAKVVLK